MLEIGSCGSQIDSINDNELDDITIEITEDMPKEYINPIDWLKDIDKKIRKILENES